MRETDIHLGQMGQNPFKTTWKDCNCTTRNVSRGRFAMNYIAFFECNRSATSDERRYSVFFSPAPTSNGWPAAPACDLALSARSTPTSSGGARNDYLGMGQTPQGHWARWSKRQPGGHGAAGDANMAGNQSSTRRNVSANSTTCTARKPPPS